jgi:hypothetical protein
MSLNAANIRVGAAHIYFGVTPPNAGAALSLTNGVPSGGAEVGLTTGESVFTYEVTFFEQDAEQSLAIVAVFAYQEKATIEFAMKEYTADNIETYFNGLVEVTDGLIEGGRGNGEITLQSVVIVAPIPNTNPRLYTWAMLFSAFQSEVAKLTYTKSSDTIMKSTFTAVADLTRADGSTLFQIGIQQPAS